MKLQCTKKLLDQMKAKPELVEVQDERFFWHANVVTVERKKMLLLVHDLTQYRIVLYGMKAKEWKNLNQVIREGIAKTWEAEGIRASVIEKYLTEMGDVTLAKTKDRSAVAKLNHAAKEAEWMLHRYEEDGLVQVETGKRTSHMLVGSGKGEYKEPTKELISFLTAYMGEPILDVSVAIMKIRLDFENLSVWRRVQVPLFLTFVEFHKVIQIAFEWQDYHLHSFYLYGDLARRDESFLNHPGWHPGGMMATRCLVDNEEALDYGDPYVTMELEQGKRLKDWLTDKMLYQYDFGDDWIHLIEVEEIRKESEPPFVRCLDGEGAAPPEDVGGEGGFEHFLKVLADESHEQHDYFREWSEGTFYPVFNVERVDKVLKRWFS